MRNPSRLLIGIGVFLFMQAIFTGVVLAETVVIGINDPAQDVKAVQDAVDKGGEILLKKFLISAIKDL